MQPKFLARDYVMSYYHGTVSGRCEMTSAFDGFVLGKVALAIEQVTRIDPADISRGTRLTDDLALGRFARLRLAVCLEEAFDLELPNEVAARFVTVGDIVGYFSRRYFRDFQSPLPAVAIAA